METCLLNLPHSDFTQTQGAVNSKVNPTGFLYIRRKSFLILR